MSTIGYSHFWNDYECEGVFPTPIFSKEMIDGISNCNDKCRKLKCKHLVISFSLMHFSFQLTAEKDKIFEVKLITLESSGNDSFCFESHQESQNIELYSWMGCWDEVKMCACARMRMHAHTHTHTHTHTHPTICQSCLQS